MFFQLFLSIIFSGAIAFILLVELPFSLNNTNNCSANVTLQVMIKGNTPTSSFATLTVVIVPPAFSKLNQHILAGIILVSKLSIHANVYPKSNLLGWLVNNNNNNKQALLPKEKLKITIIYNILIQTKVMFTQDN